MHRSQKHPICQSTIFWHYYDLTLFSTLVWYGLITILRRVVTDSFFSANKSKPKQTKSAKKYKFFSGLLKFILKQYRRFS